MLTRRNKQTLKPYIVLRFYIYSLTNGRHHPPIKPKYPDNQSRTRMTIHNSSERNPLVWHRDKNCVVIYVNDADVFFCFSFSLLFPCCQQQTCAFFKPIIYLYTHISPSFSMVFQKDAETSFTPGNPSRKTDSLRPMQHACYEGSSSQTSHNARKKNSLRTRT